MNISPSKFFHIHLLLPNHYFNWITKGNLNFSTAIKLLITIDHIRPQLRRGGPSFLPFLPRQTPSLSCMEHPENSFRQVIVECGCWKSALVCNSSRYCSLKTPSLFRTPVTESLKMLFCHRTSLKLKNTVKVSLSRRRISLNMS